MLKKIARWVLREEIRIDKGINYLEIEGLNKRVETGNITIDRLNDIVNKLKEIAYPKRGYMFTADKLTESERVIMGKCIQHEVVGLFRKWFKAKADENADLLLHYPMEKDSTRMGWSVTVRMYDDLVMQLDLCEKLMNNKAKIKAAERKAANKNKSRQELRQIKPE